MLSELQQLISSAVKENEPLAGHTTYRIGGSADYFFAATTSDEAIKALHVAKELGLSYFILGGGSNVLVSDEGFHGLLIKMANRGIEFAGTKIKIEAGTPTALVALKSVEAGLTGFEWAVGLPGTIGGAIRGNAGMFGGDTGQVIETVRCIRNGEPEQLTHEQCAFGYRDSLFKHQSGCVILSAVLALETASDLAASQQQLQAILAHKKDQQPIEYPTAGCIFKNWLPSEPEDLISIRQSLDLDSGEEIPVTPNGTVPAGWIIDRAQLKGTKVGGAMISEKHANFFINSSGASASDVIGLIAVVKTRVRNITRSVIHLQEEIEYLGF
ncbi:UDP-N-acetylmuramate dehydrogenase [Patescibacteria group bacterium]|nr:UDP-N-acetylmuramate dehydrogenase [Patescibacteria group bacterium]MBU1028651.1 UDP-N-acetylmuramate dehydrogenase [Patescibacteria group bacterium]MBU1916370.1 UDP-N-acetylmuramate dehydrogenase [Patescibacteria group bacterium]